MFDLYDQLSYPASANTKLRFDVLQSIEI